MGVVWGGVRDHINYLIATSKNMYTEGIWGGGGLLY